MSRPNFLYSVIRCSLLILSLVFLSACQTQQPANQPEIERIVEAQVRKQLLDGKAGELSGDSKRLVERLVQQSLLDPDYGDAAAAIMNGENADADIIRVIHSIERAVEITLRNIQNADTISYKASRAAGDGNGKLWISRDWSAGSIETTGRGLDMVIEGNGFFRLKVNVNGIESFGYTRNGNFFVNHDGEIVVGMGDGYRLDPTIVLPPDATEVQVSQYGDITYLKPGQTERQMASFLRVTTFQNPDGLAQYGNSIFLQTEKSGKPIENKPGENGAGKILGGFLEGSNVDTLKELLRLRYLRQWRSALVAAMNAAKPVAAK